MTDELRPDELEELDEVCSCENCAGPYPCNCPEDGWCEACSSCVPHCEKEPLCEAWRKLDEVEADNERLRRELNQAHDWLESYQSGNIKERPEYQRLEQQLEDAQKFSRNLDQTNEHLRVALQDKDTIILDWDHYSKELEQQLAQAVHMRDSHWDTSCKVIKQRDALQQQLAQERQARERLEAFFQAVAKLTWDHKDLADHAVVFPSDLGYELEKIDKRWYLPFCNEEYQAKILAEDVAALRDSEGGGE